MGRDDGNPDVDHMIDENLRKVYDSVLREEVPDRFSQLLQQLREGEGVAAEGDASRSTVRAGGDE